MQEKHETDAIGWRLSSSGKGAIPMVPGSRTARGFLLLMGVALATPAVVRTQSAAGPGQAGGHVAAMFDSDQKGDASRAPSFQLVELPAAGSAAFPVQVYLSAGDLERAFDRPEFRPDAAIVPTNTDLLI